MEGSGIRSLQQAPEGLKSVGVSLSSDVLANAVLNGLMIRQGVIGESVIGVDLRTRIDVFHNEAAHGLRLGIVDNLGGDLIRGSVFDPSYSHFTDWTAAIQFLSLGPAHVSTFPSQVSLIDFDRPREWRPVAVTRPGFPDSVEHEPSGALCDSDIPMQLHGADPFQAGQFQIDSNDPLSQGSFAMSEHGAGPNTEVLPAIGAPVGHGLMRCFLCSGGPAISAASSFWPEFALKPLGGRRFVREHFHNLNDCETVSECLPRGLEGSFHHGNSVQE